MEAVSYTKARKSLATLMDEVCENHDQIIITRQKQKSVVMMSLDDYNALEETAYLLKTIKNTQRLSEAIDDMREGKNFVPKHIE